jgi:copper chaperone CopZ
MKVLLLVTMLNSTVMAAETAAKATKATKTETAPMGVSGVIISVKGMVCSFCAQGIEKKLKAFKEVKSVEVDLDTKKVNVQFVAGQTVATEKLQETIKNSGYDVTDIQILRPQQ